MPLHVVNLTTENSLNQMKDMKDGYGMAMIKAPFHEKTGYGNGGGIDAFASNLIYFPEDNLTIANFTNGTGEYIKCLKMEYIVL
jgi:hypothetical protein